MSKINTIDIKNEIISITKIEEEDYICLTDMAKAKVGDNRAPYPVKNGTGSTGLVYGDSLNYGASKISSQGKLSLLALVVLCNYVNQLTKAAQATTTKC